MKTYLSKVFYFLGDLVSYFLYLEITSIIAYPIYRKLMLISIALDTNNIVWENVEEKQSKKTDLTLKITDENKIRNTRKHRCNKSHSN